MIPISLTVINYIYKRTYVCCSRDQLLAVPGMVVELAAVCLAQTSHTQLQSPTSHRTSSHIYIIHISISDGDLASTIYTHKGQLDSSE